MSLRNISCERARYFCIVSALEKLGHIPTRKSEKEAWFLSPLRSEIQPSSSNTIDLVIRNCIFQEALHFLSEEKSSFSFSPEIFPSPEERSDAIKILMVKDITHSALIKYFRSRTVPVEKRGYGPGNPI